MPTSPNSLADLLNALGCDPAPIIKSGTGENTGWTSVGGSAVLHQSTFTGNLGTTAYTLNDIVKALKQLGLLAR